MNKPTFTTQLEFVTPELAAQYLATKPDYQRGLKPNTVASLVRDLPVCWRTTHQGIAFDTEDKLLDGQHRCAAIVKANIGVWLLVSRGLPADTYQYVDRGDIRKVYEQLGILKTFEAISTVLAWLERGGGVWLKESAAHIDDVYQANREAIQNLISYSAAGLISAPTLGVLAYAYPLDPDQVCAFAYSLKSGANLEPQTPVLALRNYLSKPRRTRMEKLQASASAIACHLIGEKCATVRSGIYGYQRLTSKRRLAQIPRTPSASQVQAATSGVRTQKIRKGMISGRVAAE